MAVTSKWRQHIEAQPMPQTIAHRLDISYVKPELTAKKTATDSYIKHLNDDNNGFDLLGWISNG